MNPNINIRQPQDLEKELLYDYLDLVRMGLTLHELRISRQLDKLDKDIKELRDLLKDV